jgi:hypothetical protein
MEAITNLIAEHGETVLAIIGAIMVCVRAIIAAIPTPDDSTEAKKKPVIGLIGKLLGIDLTQGRSVNTVKKTTTTTKTLLLALACGFLFAGCANTTTDLHPWGVNTKNQPANPTEILPDGTQKGVYQGIGGTNLKADSDGIWAMTPGTGSIITKDGVCVYLPGDLTATDIEYDGKVFKAKTLTVSYSAPLQVQADAFTKAAEAIKDMTQIEATKQVAIMVEIGKITQNVADSLLKYFIPTLPTGIISQ